MAKTTYTIKIQTLSEKVELTWDEVFKVIGPTIYGYIWRKRDRDKATYPFRDNLEEHIRTKIIDRVQNRKINIEPAKWMPAFCSSKNLGY